MAKTPFKLIYIGGVGRSGSTLLGRTLSEVPSAVCVGEILYLWSRGIRDDVQCGCGRPFSLCPFWDAVGKEAFGGWSRLSSGYLAALDRAAAWPYTVSAYLATQLPPRVVNPINDYVTSLAALYEAISRVSGANTIIDTSKTPGFAGLLLRMPARDVRVVHLVRDSRAVAYSWSRVKRLPSPLPGPRGEEHFMARSRGVAILATKWLGLNTAFHLISRGRVSYLRLRYEDFVADPRETLRTLSAFSDEELALPSSQLTDDGITLGEHHIFSGNPMREQTGWVQIRLDDEWRNMMSESQFHQVTGITWPLLHRYGYSVSR